MKPPVCKNSTCPKYGSNDHVKALIETPEFVTFGCLVCQGVEVRVLDKRRGEQELDYQRRGRPEYARTKAFFFTGKYNRPIAR